MPKMKTNKAVAKRVKVTARGKLKVGKPGSSHLKSVKSPKRLRTKRKGMTLSKSFVKHAKRLMAR